MSRFNNSNGRTDLQKHNSSQEEPKQNESRLALLIGIIATAMLIIYGFQ